ncbi:hypothetical protein [Streptomyces sp. NPDC017529]|uniref:hypothetical protein n=1 Tax=Streptomyces sp. NPDC017529 TaxID=3365000 RepID=UPI0037906F6D
MATGGTNFAPYLITAFATLAGVAITAAFAEYRERRRSREEQQRERDQTVEERWKWLRQERRQSYAALVHLGFQSAAVLLEAAARLHDRNDSKGALELWSRLDELQDAISAQVADVQLVGSEAVVEAAHGLRRSFRHAPRELKQAVAAFRTGECGDRELDGRLSGRVRTVYRATHALVETATHDLRISLGVSGEAEV